jgi:hypothetical protein
MIGPSTDLLHPSVVPHVKNFPGIPYLLSEVPKFQHHTNLRSKYSTVPASSLHYIPVFQVKRVFFFNAALVMANVV